MVSLYLCAGVRCVSAQLYANECGVIVLGAGGAQSWHAGLHPVPELLLLYVDDALGSGLLPNHDSLFGWEHMQPMSTCLYVKGGGLSRGTFKLQGRYELTKLCTLILAPGALTRDGLLPHPAEADAAAKRISPAWLCMLCELLCVNAALTRDGLLPHPAGADADAKSISPAWLCLLCELLWINTALTRGRLLPCAAEADAATNRESKLGAACLEAGLEEGTKDQCSTKRSVQH
eukprot:1139125-Pelagomonas_calceolata.AAC.4